MLRWGCISDYPASYHYFCHEEDTLGNLRVLYPYVGELSTADSVWTLDILLRQAFLYNHTDVAAAQIVAYVREHDAVLAGKMEDNLHACLTDSRRTARP